MTSEESRPRAAVWARRPRCVKSERARKLRERLHNEEETRAARAEESSGAPENPDDPMLSDPITHLKSQNKVVCGSPYSSQGVNKPGE
ncbi:hypothetical protein EYF80_036442 [Liparis tanakae]|uniref:Uncharacterized protein n=1 Tax=Liparis tanakae TaxID=230148 RepID=A0A4Z2GJE3_9TELE|nr:hypothetical protein EYF80_036442 [Liparis tanakae]